MTTTNEWIKFRASLTEGAKRGIKRAHRFVFLELALKARTLGGIIELPIGMGDVAGLVDLLGGDAGEVKGAIPVLVRCEMIRFEGPEAERRCIVVSWARHNDAPGASTERVKRYRERVGNEVKRVTDRSSNQDETETERLGNDHKEEKRREEKRSADPPVGPPRPPTPTEAADSPPLAAPNEVITDPGSEGPRQRSIPLETPITASAKPAKASRKKPATAAPSSDENPFEVGEWLTHWKIPRLSSGPHGDEEREVAKFLDWHRAKGSTFADWTAAWRTWQRNAVEFAKGRNGGAYRPVQPPAPYSQSQSLDEWYAKNPPTGDPI